jgi:uncharacterized protein YndB with AHSA1/START domain
MTSTSRTIVVDDVFPHSPQRLWLALTDGDLMTRWLMPPTGFEAVEGARFTFQTTPAGPWDGVIHCEVLEVVPNVRFSYSWKSGDAANVGYGSPLDTVVTFTLAPAEGGTRLRLEHAGFLPRNRTAYDNMSPGWEKAVRKVAGLAGDMN